jgi:energy-coupling factor transport system permease protein
VVAFAFFTLAVGGAMVFLHPVLSAVTLAAAVAYSIYLNGRRAVKFTLLGMLPLLIGAAVFNPLFSHAGVTILAYLPDGNPLTLESIVYGWFAGAMLAAVITWFACSNQVLTSDKIQYMFGRALPALSLLFSMALRFVPRLKAQAKVIAYAQRGMGRSLTGGNVLRRARAGLSLLSILITWALENSVEVADSMRSRGHGLPGRTAFHLFRLDRRDRRVLAVFAVALAVFSAAAVSSLTEMTFYPALSLPPVNALSVAAWIAYAAVLFTPLALNSAEELTWRRMSSKG